MYGICCMSACFAHMYVSLYPLFKIIRLTAASYTEGGPRKCLMFRTNILLPSLHIVHPINKEDFVGLIAMPNPLYIYIYKPLYFTTLPHYI